MKKVTLALVGLAFAGSCAFAQTNQVLSRNAVGYVKVEVDKGELALVRMDFENLQGVDNTVTNLIGDQLPSGSSVLLWDKVAQQYTAENKIRSGWSPGTNVITRGTSMFLKPSATAASNTYTVFLMGEVPDRFTAPTTTVLGVTGLNPLGFPYPVQVAWTNTGLAKNSVSGDSLLVWDQNIQNYVAYNRTRSGWGAGETLVLQPGQGFWFRNVTSTQDWSEVKPYTWP
ncbi:MAG: hypothetical protein H7A43_10910 [Verrucomicrobia bacterium]|nr:hypothetical protein [Verrucomicrobiota bacterium]